jgi:glycosyltransferase involved in cell wall biosynthesis
MLRFFNRLDVVTAPSKTAAAILRRRGLRVPVYPISCGVDLSRFHWDASVDRSATRQRYGLAPDRCMFLFVGRVDGEKRLDVLLHALALLKRDDIQLAIAGKGAALKGLKALARALKLGDRVRFLGFVPDGDLPALLNSADIFTMPSEAELLSIATLEAMACGRPLLVAQAEALPELVTPGVNGYLFQPGNPVDAARHMALLAAQPLRWASMGAASLDKVQHHSLENTVSSYEKIYESLSLNHPLPNLYTVSPARRLASKRKRQTVTEFWR